MDMLALVLVGLIVGGAVVWLWGKRQGTVRAADEGGRTEGAAVGPTKVVMPEPPEEPGPRPQTTRTGENQELKRKVVHGPYRPIEDRGPQTRIGDDK